MQHVLSLVLDSIAPLILDGENVWEVRPDIGSTEKREDSKHKAGVIPLSVVMGEGQGPRSKLLDEKRGVSAAVELAWNALACLFKWVYAFVSC